MESGVAQVIFVRELIGPSLCVGCFGHGGWAKIYCKYNFHGISYFCLNEGADLNNLRETDF